MKNHWLMKRRSKEVPVWDFQTALGDTIREKYESLYVKIVHVSNVVFRKTLTQQNWLIVPDRKD